MASTQATVGTLPAGSGIGGTKLVQTVISQTNTPATGTTKMPFGTGLPQNTDGDQYMTINITPTNASNTLLIYANAFLTSNTADEVTGALYQTGTASALSTQISYCADGNALLPYRIIYTMAAGSTSALTFTFRAGVINVTTCYFNRTSSATTYNGSMTSSIIIQEIVL